MEPSPICKSAQILMEEGYQAVKAAHAELSGLGMVKKILPQRSGPMVPNLLSCL
jgi:hypothetical protein